jgi:putative transposase
MIRAFRYPLRLNQQESAGLDEIRLACQRLYNAALEQRKDAYRKQKKSISRYDQHKDLTELREADSEGYSSISSLILRSSLNRLDEAYKAFFRRIKQGEKPGFPRFKGKDRYDSFSFSNPVIKDNLLTIPKFGQVKLHLYRPIKGIPLEAHIRKTYKGWETSIICDLGEAPSKVEIKTSTGIDVGINHFVTFSDGLEVENPRFYRKSEVLLAYRQQRLAYKKNKHSNSRKRAKLLVSKIHQHIKNQRLDFARKLAKEVINKYDLIAIEDLNIKGMVQNHNLSKSVNDASWSIFAACLNFKAEYAGKTIVAVDPRGTSQICSRCGKVVKKTLANREHNCPYCGLVLGRDHNSAIEILARGLRAVSQLRSKDLNLAEAA